MENFNVNLSKEDFNTFNKNLNREDCITEDIELDDRTLNLLDSLASSLGCSVEDACSYVLHKGVEMMKNMDKEQLDKMFAKVQEGVRNEK